MGGRVMVFSWAERFGWLVILVAASIWVPVWYGTFSERKLAKQADPERYMVVHHVDVGNSMVGDRVLMNVGRDVLLPFDGTYWTQVRKYPERSVVCTANDSLPYGTNTTLPNPITLEWWANDGECSGHNLPAGDYIITTQWDINHGLEGVAPGRVEKDSNPFTILPIAPDIQSLEQQLKSLQQKIQ